jgi:hypothetical protein
LLIPNHGNPRPSINDGWEAGVKFSPLPWLNGRVAYWEQRASGEVARVLQVKNVTNRSLMSLTLAFVENIFAWGASKRCDGG